MATVAPALIPPKRPKSPSLESSLPAPKRASLGTAYDPVLLASSLAAGTVEEDREKAVNIAAATRPKRIRKATVSAVISYKSYSHFTQTHFDDDITDMSLEGVYGRTGEATRVCRDMRDADEEDEDGDGDGDGCWVRDDGEVTTGCRTETFEVELSEDEAEADERERELKEAWQKGYELGLAEGIEEGLRKGVEQGVQKVMCMRALEEEMTAAC